MSQSPRQVAQSSTQQPRPVAAVEVPSKSPQRRHLAIPSKPTLSRLDVVLALAKATKTSKQQSRRYLDTLVDWIKARVTTGHKVELRGFTSWSLKRLKARKGRNPATGEAVQVEAKLRGVAKASQQFLKGRRRRKAEGTGT